MPKITTIIIEQSDRFDKRVPVGVNARVAHITIGKETPVGDHILRALDAAGIAYTVVSSPDETGGSDSGVGSEPPTDLTSAPPAPKKVSPGTPADKTPGKSDADSEAEAKAAADAAAKAKAAPKKATTKKAKAAK